MIMRLKHSFERGFEKIRWFSTLVSERFKVELAVIRLLRESDDLERKRRECIQAVGERVFELRGREEVNLLDDRSIREALREAEDLDRTIGELKARADEIGKVGEE